MSDKTRYRLQGALIALALVVGALACIGAAWLAQQIWAIQWW